jgi:hypothetical protein
MYFIINHYLYQLIRSQQLTIARNQFFEMEKENKKYINDKRMELSISNKRTDT